jgi:type IV pilus assembly protein PilE
VIISIPAEARLVKTSRQNNGFTLIELMMTLVVVAILTTIAVPSYQAQVRKTRRAEAQAGLMELQNFMERYFTSNNCYQDKGADKSCAETGDNVNPVLPFTALPKGGTAYYSMTLSAAGAGSYTLRATPSGAQAGDGLLELDHTGARRWDKNKDGDASDSGEGSWDR